MRVLHLTSFGRPNGTVKRCRVFALGDSVDGEVQDESVGWRLICDLKTALY